MSEVPKSTIQLCAIIVLLAWGQLVSAQRDRPQRYSENKHSFIAEVGIGGYDFSRDKDFAPGIFAEPNFGANYRYQINPLWSIGGAYFYEKSVSAEISEGYDQAYLEYGQVDAIRHAFSIEGLRHYGNNPRYSFYSGVRLGLAQWKNEISDGYDPNAPGPQYEEDETGVFPTYKLTLIGTTIKVTNNFFVGGEVGIGTENVLALQAGLRF